MRAYGHDWHQTLIGRIESAQRPLRLNEAVDMAALYGVPLERLLNPSTEGVSAEYLDGQIHAARRELQDARRTHEEVKRRWDRATAALVHLGDELKQTEAIMSAAQALLARLTGIRARMAAQQEQESSL
jgi:hypothetical protein